MSILNEWGRDILMRDAGLPRELLDEAGVGGVLRAEDAQFAGVMELESLGAAARVVFTGGTWPGASRGPRTGRDAEVAGATARVWIDANAHWVAWLRALYPNRPAVLGYLPPGDGGRISRFDTLELALAEAWAGGGNYILALEPRYREALLRREEAALAAWRRMGATARWLQSNAGLFGRPAAPEVTVLVEAGEETAELANLMFRNNVSPRLVNAAHPPAPDSARILALVAASLRTPPRDVARRILAHAEAGATVVVDEPGERAWWRAPGIRSVRAAEDREFYKLGRGQVVAYRERIADPGEFALDVIDLISQPRRAVRVWGAAAVIATAADGAAVLVNYGWPSDNEIQVRVQGAYRSATLLRPESAPVELKAARRGTMTEVFVPQMRRIAVISLR